MTATIINDPESIARQRTAAEGFEAQAELFGTAAIHAREAGEWQRAVVYAEQADISAQVAERIRMRLVALSGLTEGDVAVSAPPDPVRRVPVQVPEHLTPEPPVRLVELYQWLRSLLGTRFPWVTSETWQAVAAILMANRGGR